MASKLTFLPQHNVQHMWVLLVADYVIHTL